MAACRDGFSDIELQGLVEDRTAAVFNLANAVDDPEAFWELIRRKKYVHTSRDA
jgi:hypothetical protein